MEKLSGVFLHYCKRRQYICLIPSMCLSLCSSASPHSYTTSLFPCAGLDNSRLHSLSQESSPCPEAALLQAAPPCSAWIRQCFWRQQFFQAALLPFLTYHSRLLMSRLFPPFSRCPYRLVVGVPYLSYHPCWLFPLSIACGAACQSHMDGSSHQPCNHYHGLPAPLFFPIQTRGMTIINFTGGWELISMQKTC